MINSEVGVTFLAKNTASMVAGYVLGQEHGELRELSWGNLSTRNLFQLLNIAFKQKKIA
jgi:hypothetical protein